MFVLFMLKTTIVTVVAESYVNFAMFYKFRLLACVLNPGGKSLSADVCFVVFSITMSIPFENIGILILNRRAIQDFTIRAK